MKGSSSICLVVLFAALLCLTNARAEDFSFAFEGDPFARLRLAPLQGAKEPPKLRLKNWINSKKLTLAALKGKIVVLHFWATWYRPCLAGLPRVEEIRTKFKEDVVFLGICHPSGAQQVAQLVKEQSIDCPIAVDTDRATIKAYEANGYSDFYVIDRDGTLVVADCANSKLEEVLNRLLGKRGE